MQRGCGLCWFHCSLASPPPACPVCHQDRQPAAHARRDTEDSVRLSSWPPARTRSLVPRGAGGSKTRLKRVSA